MDVSFGDYVFNVNNLLGEGSYGSVYKGLNKKTKQAVAIKAMSMENFYDTKHLELLKNEIKIMKELQGPYIAKLYEVFASKSFTYIVMEYAESDLRHYI